MPEVRFGGSFAPSLDDVTVQAYRALARGATTPAVEDAMLKLCDMVDCFNETPPLQTKGGTPHPSGRGVVTPLPAGEVERLWDVVPWDYECDAIQALFDSIPPVQKDLRDAAFHLAWYARELCLERMPITTESLKGG